MTYQGLIHGTRGEDGGLGGGAYEGFIRGTRGEWGLYKAPEVRIKVWVEVHIRGLFRAPEVSQVYKFLMWTSTQTSTRLWWSPVVPYKGVFACGSIYILTLSHL